MTRIATPLIVLLLCGTALAGCASDNTGPLSELSSSQNAESSVNTAALPTNVDGGVRQARALRLAGHYHQAIHTLSQLMLVASDDPSVVSEYGKTLVEEGRGQDAIDFLNRAIALRPTKWSYYSALGVAYDEIGDEDSARRAYERALQLKPNEPSILNNYALSRLMAKDPQAARQLMARAKRAGGASDPKIARNIALVDKLAAEAPVEPKTASSDISAGAAIGSPTPVNTKSLPPVVPSAQNKSEPAARMAEHKSTPKFQIVPAKAASHGPRKLTTEAAAKPDQAAPKKPAKLVRAAQEHRTAQKSQAKASKADSNAVALRKDTKPAKEQVADAKPVKAAKAKPAAKSAVKSADKGIPALRMTASAD